MSDEVGGYRSLSAAAVGALLLGLAAPLAMINPLLVIVPIAGVLLSIYAIRSIRLNANLITGIAPALAGAFLCVLVIAYLPARRAFRSQELISRAEKIGGKFWEHLQAGRKYEAHQLHARKFLSRDPAIGLAKYYAEEQAAQLDFDRFYSEATLKGIVESAEGFKAEYLSGELGEPNPEGDTVILRYRIRKADQSSGTTAPDVWLIVQRKLEAETGERQWSVSGITGRDPFEAKN